MSRLRSGLMMLRYRARLLRLRLRLIQVSRFDLFNLLLALVGAWTVVAAISQFLPLDSKPAITGFWVGAIICLFGLYWLMYARRPQDIFRLAAKSDVQSQQLRSWMTTGMQNDAAYAVLEELYEPLFRDLIARPEFAGTQWPEDARGRRALVLTLPTEDNVTLDEILDDRVAVREPAWRSRVAGFAGERQALMATLRRDANLANPFGDEGGENLVLERLSGSPRIDLSAATATYGQIVRTSDALINEFALMGHLLERSAFRQRVVPLRLTGAQALRVLPWRREVHSWDAGIDVLVAPKGRASGLGVSVALQLHSSDGKAVSAILARRSANVGTYPDALHVIPAGMINVHSPNPATDELGIGRLPKLTMLAEFVEECFDVVELSGHSLGNFEARVWRELAGRGLTQVSPVFTGIAIDLLNLRTEICATIDLTDYRAVVDDFVVSWEFTHNEDLRRVNLAHGSAVTRREEFVQSGIGALHLAQLQLRRLAGEGAES
jgi:hypothetical protein